MRQRPRRERMSMTSSFPFAWYSRRLLRPRPPPADRKRPTRRRSPPTHERFRPELRIDQWRRPLDRTQAPGEAGIPTGQTAGRHCRGWSDLPVDRRERPARGRDPGLPDQGRVRASGPVDRRIYIARSCDHHGDSNGRTWWAPTVPGLVLKPLPGAPKPAGSAAQRLRQMRSLADGFRASDNFKRKGWSELRLLPTPITRYGKDGTAPSDGALFAFVLGTDPEVFLFLEISSGKSGPVWQYCAGTDDGLRGEGMVSWRPGLGVARPRTFI